MRDASDFYGGVWAEHERELLQEAYPNEPVHSGFIVKFTPLDEPVDRIMFEAFDQQGSVLVRLWFERSQFVGFLALAFQVAHDAGFYDR